MIIDNEMLKSKPSHKFRANVYNVIMFDSLSLTHCRHKFSTNMMLALCQADTAKDCRQVYMQIHNELLTLTSIDIVDWISQGCV